MSGLVRWRADGAELTIDTAELLREAGPWGQAFPEPLFDGQFRLICSSVWWASVI